MAIDPNQELMPVKSGSLLLRCLASVNKPMARHTSAEPHSLTFVSCAGGFLVQGVRNVCGQGPLIHKTGSAPIQCNYMAVHYEQAPAVVVNSRRQSPWHGAWDPLQLAGPASGSAHSSLQPPGALYGLAVPSIFVPGHLSHGRQSRWGHILGLQNRPTKPPTPIHSHLTPPQQVLSPSRRP
jgi:hypothetical protein